MKKIEIENFHESKEGQKWRPDYNSEDLPAIEACAWLMNSRTAACIRRNSRYVCSVISCRCYVNLLLIPSFHFFLCKRMGTRLL